MQRVNISIDKQQHSQIKNLPRSFNLSAYVRQYIPVFIEDYKRRIELKK